MLKNYVSTFCSVETWISRFLYCNETTRSLRILNIHILSKGGISGKSTLAEYTAVSVCSRKRCASRLDIFPSFFARRAALQYSYLISPRSGWKSVFSDGFEPFFLKRGVKRCVCFVILGSEYLKLRFLLSKKIKILRFKISKLRK